MKNLIMALTLVGFTYFGAEAQTKEAVACGAPKNKVCKKSGGKVACYDTKYANDYKVCKGDYGYFICCETPNFTNSTHPDINMVDVKHYPNPMQTRDYDYEMASTQTNEAEQKQQQAMIAPHSQSYPEYAMNSATSYEGYYNRRHSIKVCYAGENIAELNKAAYHGCATPAYDGPEKNKHRNMNSNNVIDNIAPISGQAK